MPGTWIDEVLREEWRQTTEKLKPLMKRRGRDIALTSHLHLPAEREKLVAKYVYHKEVEIDE